jgi:hypothetical protein
MPLDIDELKTGLTGLLRLIQSLDDAPRDVAEHLRFPAWNGTLTGSDLGARLWASSEGQLLLGCLLSDDELRERFSPPPKSRLIEIWARTASFVRAWADSGAEPEVFCAQWAEAFEAALKPESVAVAAVQFFYGAALQESVELVSGQLYLEPSSVEQLCQWLTHTGCREVDKLRIPRQPLVLAVTICHSSTAHLPPAILATTVAGFTRVVLERMRYDLWLVTGVLPRPGDTWVFEQSPFPFQPLEHFAPDMLHAFGGSLQDPASGVVGATPLTGVVRRFGFLFEDDCPEDVAQPLVMAWRYAVPAIDSPDARMTLLLSYAAIDGLLRTRDEDDSVISHRVARLIQGGVEEGRRIRRIMDRWRDLRGRAAHGHPMPENVLLGFVEELALPTDFLSDREFTVRMKGRCLRVLRRVFLAMLHLGVALEGTPSNAQPGLTRSAVLELVDRANQGDQTAASRIQSLTPNWARAIAL